MANFFFSFRPERKSHLPLVLVSLSARFMEAVLITAFHRNVIWKEPFAHFLPICVPFSGKELPKSQNLLQDHFGQLQP